MTSPADPFGLVGARLDGKYDIDSVVAEGGFGVVYRATHRTLGTSVAVKVLSYLAAFRTAQTAASDARVAVPQPELAPVVAPALVPVPTVAQALVNVATPPREATDAGALRPASATATARPTPTQPAVRPARPAPPALPRTIGVRPAAPTPTASRTRPAGYETVPTE